MPFLGGILLGRLQLLGEFLHLQGRKALAKANAMLKTPDCNTVNHWSES